MANRAIHIRFFKWRVYLSPQQSNILSSVLVRIRNCFAVFTLKNFAFSFANPKAEITHLRSTSRINRNNRDTFFLSFIFNHLSKLVERPFTKSCSMFLPSVISSKSYAFKILKNNALTRFFGFFNDSFADSVIYYFTMCPLFSRKPFQQFITIACAFGINRTSYFLTFLSVIIQRFRRKPFTITKGCNFNQTKINPQPFLNIFNIFFGYFTGLKQIKFSFPVNQICFAFNIGKIFFGIRDKRHFQPAVNRPDRTNSFIKVVGKYSGIVSNRTKFLKNSLFLFIEFVRISTFRYATDNHLGRKIKGRFDRVIFSSMQFELIKNFIFKSIFRKFIASCVCFLNCI